MSDLDPQDIRDFKDAVRNFEQAVSQMSGSMGRGTSAAGASRPISRNGGKNAARGNPAMSAADRLAAKMQDDSNKALGAFGKALDKATDAAEDSAEAQRKLKRAQEDYEREVKDLRSGIKGFGKDLLTGDGSLASAFGSLSKSVYKPTTMFGKVLTGVSFGVSAAISALDTFAKEAAGLGAYADLSSFSVGSVRQAKLISGLGDSFIKAIASSNGGFRAFGKTSEEAVENFAQMARAMRSGFINPFSKFGRSLDTTTKKQFQDAANASASMGLSAEDTGELMGSLSAQIKYMAKNEDDATKLFARGLKESTEAARDLSVTFGVSAKDMLKAMNDFKVSLAGGLEAANNGQGGAMIAATLQKLAPNLSKEEQQNAAFLISQGRGGEAAAYGKDAATVQAITELAKVEAAARAKGGGTLTEENYFAGLRGAAGNFQNIGQGYTQGPLLGNEANARGGLAALQFGKDLARTPAQIAEDAKNKPGTSEADNIKSMNQLTAALDSLRATVSGLTATIVGVLGTFGTILAAGTLGGLMGGGKGILGKLGGMIPGKWNPMMANQGPQLPGASGAFSKLSGAAGSGMSSFGDFLGKLGSTDAVKGASVLALLGGALALSAHGFKTFGEVSWEGMIKGTLALGGLMVLARFVGAATTEMVKGAAAIAILGAAMWVAGKGFKEFNDLNWEGIAKGVVALAAFGVAAGVMGTFLPAILLGSVAIAALGASLVVFGAGAYLAAKAAEVFAGALKTIGEVDGLNLIAIGGGLAAIGAGMIVFTAGMIAGTASSVITGIMSLFGAKSPLDRIMEFVPYADKIALIGEGIKNFGEGIIRINTGLGNFDTDAFSDFKDLMLDFAKTGSSDEMRLTAEYLTSIGTALNQISTVTPNMPSSLPTIDTGEGAGSKNNAGPSTADSISEVISYLSNIQSELQGIRSNTKADPISAPVRLS